MSKPAYPIRSVDGSQQFAAVSVHDLRPIAPEYGMTIRAWKTPEDAAHQGSGHQVGYIDMGHTGEIRGIWTEPESRRKGVATALLSEARKHFGDIVHHSTVRTDAGEAWARAQGAPPRERSTEWDGINGMYAP